MQKQSYPAPPARKPASRRGIPCILPHLLKAQPGIEMHPLGAAQEDRHPAFGGEGIRHLDDEPPADAFAPQSFHGLAAGHVCLTICQRVGSHRTDDVPFPFQRPDPGKTPAEGVENLAKAVEDYRDNKLGMNKSFQDCGVEEDYFWSVLDQIGMRAYEDQCTPANPRIPMIEDMKDIAVAAYYGVPQAEGHKIRVEREGVAATEEASERV